MDWGTDCRLSITSRDTKFNLITPLSHEKSQQYRKMILPRSVLLSSSTEVPKPVEHENPLQISRRAIRASFQGVQRNLYKCAGPKFANVGMRSVICTRYAFTVWHPVFFQQALLTGATSVECYRVAFVKHNVAFVPPKPKLFVNTMLTSRS